MSDKCPKCGASRVTYAEAYGQTGWACGSRMRGMWPGFEQFNRADPCRIRELEQQLAASLPIADVRAWAESSRKRYGLDDPLYEAHRCDGYNAALSDLLAWLDEREK